MKTTHVRVWAVTQPLRILGWPSSHCSECPPETTGTALWKYESTHKSTRLLLVKLYFLKCNTNSWSILPLHNWQLVPSLHQSCHVSYSWGRQNKHFRANPASFFLLPCVTIPRPSYTITYVTCQNQWDQLTLSFTVCSLHIILTLHNYPGSKNLKHNSPKPKTHCLIWPVTQAGQGQKREESHLRSITLKLKCYYGIIAQRHPKCVAYPSFDWSSV